VDAGIQAAVLDELLLGIHALGRNVALVVGTEVEVDKTDVVPACSDEKEAMDGRVSMARTVTDP
jgi:hypothetical protein